MSDTLGHLADISAGVGDLAPSEGYLRCGTLMLSARSESITGTSRNSGGESARNEFWCSALQFLFGLIGLAFITFAAFRLHLQPGSISLLYLIVVVFVSLRAGFVLSIAVSFVALLFLNYFFVPLFSSLGARNPLDIVATVAFLTTASVISAMVARVRKLTEAQLTLRFEERLAERTRIARELHDTLLQSFQALMLHFQVVNDMVPPGKTKEALEKVLDRADQAIVEGREAIQNLRSSTTLTNELAHALTALGEELAGTPDGKKGSASFRVSVEGKARELHPILRDDIYRIAGEALRNAFRHAQASKIEADITYGDNLLRLRIRDNGKGIDPKLLVAGRDGHWGLPGMRERAEQIGAQLDIWSEAGAGTEIDLRIPGSVAYGTSSGRGIFRFVGQNKEVSDER
jgi:signal transduction histidine kinase